MCIWNKAPRCPGGMSVGVKRDASGSQTACRVQQGRRRSRQSSGFGMRDISTRDIASRPTREEWTGTERALRKQGGEYCDRRFTLQICHAFIGRHVGDRSSINACPRLSALLLSLFLVHRHFKQLQAFKVSSYNRAAPGYDVDASALCSPSGHTPP